MQLVGVIDVERPPAIEADVVGDVDDRIDRPQADRLQALLHPGWRRTVRDAANVAAGKARAGVLGALGKLEPDVDRAFVLALDARDLRLRLQLPEPAGSKVAR